MATVKKTESTTTGINKAGIPKISTAIENYKKSIVRKIDLKTTKSQIEKGIKGPETEKALTSMMAAIETEMESLMKTLDSRKTQLEEVLASYGTHDKGNTSFNIKNSAE